MARVEILESLKNRIIKKFKGESKNIFKLILSLEENPNKGKVLGSVSGVLIKELKYKGFRFYFVVDGCKIKFLGAKELQNFIIRFVRMSDKKSQQKIIDEIKCVLRNLGDVGFDD